MVSMEADWRLATLASVSVTIKNLSAQGFPMFRLKVVRVFFSVHLIPFPCSDRIYEASVAARLPAKQVLVSRACEAGA